MRKHIFGRQLQRDVNERKALFKSLMSELVIHESIQTTEPKAKAIKGQIEKVITTARVGGVNAERMLLPYFSAPVLTKLMKDIAPRFAGRPGGYTRIIKLGNRLHDNAKMVVLELVEKKPEVIKAEIINPETQTGTKSEVIEATASVEKKTKKTTEKRPPVKKDTKEAKKK